MDAKDLVLRQTGLVGNRSISGDADGFSVSKFAPKRKQDKQQGLTQQHHFMRKRFPTDMKELDCSHACHMRLPAPGNDRETTSRTRSRHRRRIPHGRDPRSVRPTADVANEAFDVVPGPLSSLGGGFWREVDGERPGERRRVV